jgi:hypothetical protein
MRHNLLLPQISDPSSWYDDYLDFDSHMARAMGLLWLCFFDGCWSYDYRSTKLKLRLYYDIEGQGSIAAPFCKASPTSAGVNPTTV